MTWYFRSFRIFARQLLDWLKPKPGETVLDLGAGTGALTQRAAEHGCRVTAIDYSPGMVARLSALDAAHQALEMSMHELRFPDQSFNGALAGFSLHVAGNPTQAVREVFRVLRPGGWFGFSVPAVSPDDQPFLLSRPFAGSTHLTLIRSCFHTGNHAHRPACSR